MKVSQAVVIGLLAVGLTIGLPAGATVASLADTPDATTTTPTGASSDCADPDHHDLVVMCCEPDFDMCYSKDPSAVL